MRTILALTLVVIYGLLSACAITSHPMDMTQAVQSATTRGDHIRLAQHYEAAGQDMQAKAADHTRMLARYEAKQGIVGSQRQSLINHCKGLVWFYEHAAAENMSLAQLHRQLAAEAPEVR